MIFEQVFGLFGVVLLGFGIVSAGLEVMSHPANGLEMFKMLANYCNLIMHHLVHEYYSLRYINISIICVSIDLITR